MSLVHYTLRNDWPAFFERPITFNIYERDMLFEESVSAVGLSCHGLLRYRCVYIDLATYALHGTAPLTPTPARQVTAPGPAQRRAGVAEGGHDGGDVVHRRHAGRRGVCVLPPCCITGMSN